MVPESTADNDLEGRRLNGSCDQLFEKYGLSTLTDDVVGNEAIIVTKVIDQFLGETAGGATALQQAFDAFTSIPEKEYMAQYVMTHHPMADLISCAAEKLDGTISFGVSSEVSILGFNGSNGISFIFGEDGQRAASWTKGYGGTIALASYGSEVSYSFSHRQLHGGFNMVGSTIDEPDVCVSIGYSVYAGAATQLVVTPGHIEDDANHIAKLFEKAVHDIMEGGDSTPQLTNADMMELALVLTGQARAMPGVTSVGMAANVGVGILDIIPIRIFLPDVTISSCHEDILFCDGYGCEDKKTIDMMDDGTVCDGLTFKTCANCHNPATWWPGKVAYACGTEPKWEDGTVCLDCTGCKNSATWWPGKAACACGTEPKWEDGTLCLDCNGCKTFWESRMALACGTEQCWGQGTLCNDWDTCPNRCCAKKGQGCFLGVCTCA